MALEASSSFIACGVKEAASSLLTGRVSCDLEVATLEKDTFFVCFGCGVMDTIEGLDFGFPNNWRFGGASIFAERLNREACSVRVTLGLAVLTGPVLCDTGLLALGLMGRSVLGLLRRIDLGLSARELSGLGLSGLGLAGLRVLTLVLGLAALLGLESLGLVFLRVVLGLLARGLRALGLRSRGLPGRGLSGRGEVRRGLTCAAVLGLTTMEMLFSLEYLTGCGSSGTLIPSPCTNDTNEFR